MFFAWRDIIVMIMTIQADMCNVNEYFFEVRDFFQARFCVVDNNIVVGCRLSHCKKDIYTNKIYRLIS